MKAPDVVELGLPTLADLGSDLLQTTPRQRWLTLLRPCVGVALFVVIAYLQFWWLTPLITFFIFVSVVTAAHDVVHGSLGLRRRQTELMLFLTGIVLLESGHAYRTTHLQHHRRFPAEDDPEGYPAKLRFIGAILYGPIFLVRLWLWAFQRNVRHPDQQYWLIVEAVLPFLALVGGIILWPATPALLLYVVMALIGSWVYPLLTVYLPHRAYGETPLTQTHTLRGRIIPAIFLELTYHLEHHLYPQVPSHHLKDLAQRLDPTLRQLGVQPWHVL